MITSPPYNLEHGTLDAPDCMDHEAYLRMLRKAFAGVARVLKQNGLLVVDVADWVDTSVDARFPLHRFITDTCVSLGLRKVSEFRYYSSEYRSLATPTELRQLHARLQRILVFAFRAEVAIQRSYIRNYYMLGQREPDVFWSDDLVSDLFQTFQLKGASMVDPFAGSGKLGKCVLQSEGKFRAYEISRQRFREYLR